MNWTCKFCKKEEIVYEVTNGKLFVMHHCRGFDLLAPPGRSRKGLYQYVSRLRQFFHQPPVEITVFPLKEVA